MNAVTLVAITIISAIVVIGSIAVAHRLMKRDDLGKGAKTGVVAGVGAVFLILLATLFDLSGSKLPVVGGPMTKNVSGSYSSNPEPAAAPKLKDSVSADDKLKEAMEKLGTRVDELNNRPTSGN